MYTTIAVSSRVRDQIKEFGNKGETYNEILEKLIKSAKDRQIQELLMDTSDSITAREALEKAKRKWR